ncbi:nicotinate-nucleotide adenylyltransferase [Propionivibrio sp.]|uniref:nicotinate-nucleotide adenylyltransferase n=1 Tax=Propionivibrio sp. TaxID=2212460 RepID=UPI003BF34503
MGTPLGIFGGTFDPVHFGHLRLAEEAAESLGLERVRWIPAGQPTHRRLENKPPRVAAAHRLEMVRLAIAGNARFELDPAQTEADGPSYTVPTLERLRLSSECGAQQPLVLLVGADAFAGLPTWHRWESLFDLAHIAVAHRPGFPIETGSLPPALAAIYQQRHCDSPSALEGAPGGRIVTFAMTQLDISATQIRRLLANQGSPRYLLPDAVIAYIENQHLYPEK